MTLTGNSAYLLGHSDLEHRRLMIQAHYLRPCTTRLLRSAGLEDGMSVLDVGAGLGDVSLIAAEIVGPAGSVVGVERDPSAVRKARERVASAGTRQVEFTLASLDEFATDRRFDALVGRLVLQYQPDPVATLRRLARFVKPGGIVAFHDMDFSNEGASWPPCALWDDCYAMLARLFDANGLPADFGRRLPAVFQAAGLPWPNVEITGLPGGKPGSTVFSWLGSAVEALASHFAEAGIDLPPEAVGVPSLTEALEAAALAAGSLVTGSTQYGVWSRLP